MKEVILEPNWKKLWAWFMQVKKDDPVAFKGMKNKMGSVEWEKFKNIAEKG